MHCEHGHSAQMLGPMRTLMIVGPFIDPFGRGLSDVLSALPCLSCVDAHP